MKKKLAAEKSESPVIPYVWHRYLASIGIDCLKSLSEEP